MGPMDFYFDVRDIFRAPRLALSGKKIWIFVIGNLAGYILYWVFSYLSLIMTGMTFADAISQYGLYPCLFGNKAEWYAWVTYFIGLEAWFLAIFMAYTSVSRVTFKQLKGNDFFSAGDAWQYTNKHWHPIVFAPIAILLIIAFFLGFASIFSLIGKIPFVGEFLFAVPYFFYFFGSVFTVYTAIVFIVSLLYTPAIVGTYEEDTMGTVFQSYSITWSQPWRVIAYNAVLIPLVVIGLYLLSLSWSAGFWLVNYVFGCDWFMGMGTKFGAMVNYAKSLVFLDWMCSFLASFCCNVSSFLNQCLTTYFFSFDLSLPTTTVPLSGTESVASVFLAISFFILLLSVLSYALSIIAVGETIMFIIFKKKSDDDNLLDRKDEDELEEDMEDDFDFDEDELENTDSDDISSDDTSSKEEA